MKSKLEIEELILELSKEKKTWEETKYRGEYNYERVRTCSEQICVLNEKIRVLKWVIGELREGEK